ncbi:hypothetical protein [Paenibacillus luteus]|uniref:hypothetical protein n=1 Tax=Paenibacillus luteus TaxID=2545753 RepID=UPI003BA9B89D
MYSGISLRFLSNFPTSYSVLKTDEEPFHAKIKEMLSTKRGRSEAWVNERVKRLLHAAKQNPFEQTVYASHFNVVPDSFVMRWFLAVQCGLIRCRSTRIKKFYDRKRAEGTPHKVALVACANKLVHWLHAILKNKKAFRPT